MERGNVDEVQLLEDLNKVSSRISGEVRIAYTSQEIIQSFLQQT